MANSARPEGPSHIMVVVGSSQVPSKICTIILAQPNPIHLFAYVTTSGQVQTIYCLSQMSSRIGHTMKIIPVQPERGSSEASSVDLEHDEVGRTLFGFRSTALRRTFGKRLPPSRRTFGFRGPSRRTFGRQLPPSRRTFGREIGRASCRERV